MENEAFILVIPTVYHKNLIIVGRVMRMLKEPLTPTFF